VVVVVVVVLIFVVVVARDIWQRIHDRDSGSYDSHTTHQYQGWDTTTALLGHGSYGTKGRVVWFSVEWKDGKRTVSRFLANQYNKYINREESEWKGRLGIVRWRTIQKGL